MNNLMGLNMDINVVKSSNDNINKVESKRLLDLLEHYNILPDRITKQDDTFLIVSKTDIYWLRKIKDSHKKALVSLQLNQYLIDNGFNNILEHIKTREGKELLKYNSSYYYLTRFIECRAGTYHDFNDIKNVAVLLAKFHLKSQGYYNKHIDMDYKSYNWSSKLEKYKETFRIIMENTKNKRIKTMFDILFMDSIEFFEEQLELSVRLLNGSNYNRLLRSSQLKCTLCLDNFKFKNILVSDKEEYYFADLADVKYNMIVFDLCKLLKKTLYRKQYAWEFKYAREIIDNYCSINPLTRDDLTILLSLMIFPKLFYKLGKKRYVKRKKWDENKYLSKLFKVTDYMDKQKLFVEEYLTYYCIE